MAKRLCALHKAEQDQAGMLYITIDGDNIGQKVGRAVLNDDEAALINMSNIINGAQQFMAETLQKLGGKIIELGGDELTAKIPQSAIPQLEQMRQQVQQQFGFTVTCGIGTKLSEAAKSLLVGKSNGKDQIVIYGPEIDQQLSEVSNRLNNGQGSEEDQKISEHYLEGNDMKESEDKKDPKAQAPDQDHEHSGDDCEYCREMDADPDQDQEAQEGEASPAEGQDPDQDPDADQEDGDHDEEECEYCSAADGQDADSDGESQDADGQDTETSGEQIGEVPPSSPTIDEHTEEGMKQIAEAIEDQEGGNPAEQDLPAADQMPVSENMDDGTSRPDDYDNDDSGEHTLGLSEDDADKDEGPDLGSVLQDGLDSHAENIQKEKVSQMVGEALQGFKSQKKVLEMAKEQAPEFYQASIAMLRSMIEMAKMLGFSGDDEVPTQEAGPDQAQAPEKQVPQEKPAASAKEGGAPPPKPKGQSAKA